ncbi:MAG: REP element-mobilizing transposase RayT [Bacteroidia bacterium]|jgi:REP element-mobilizing transposase RayT
MSHSYFSVYLHYVFATKKRQNDITPEIEKTYKKVFASICQDHGCFLMAANGTENQKEHHKTISFDKEYELMLEEAKRYAPH